VRERDAIILVVEPEEALRDSIQQILAQEGLPLRSAESAATALEIAREIQPAVVLLASCLPDGDSVEFLALLEKSSPSSRVILLSDASDHDLVLDALDRGATDYLAKPLHRRETRLAVQRAMRAWRSEQEAARLHQVLAGLANRWEELKELLVRAPEGDRPGILAQATVDTAAAVVGAGKVSLMLLDEPGNWLRVEACSGHSVSPAEMDVVLPGEGVAGFALIAGEPVAVADARTDRRFRHIVVPGRYDGHSFLLVPLVRAGRPFGVLCASESQGGGPFHEEALTLLRLLAEQFSATRMFTGAGQGWPGGVATSIGPLAGPVVEDPLDQGWLDRLEALPKSDEESGFELDAGIAREICRAVTDELEPEKMLVAALGSLAAALPATPVSLYLADPDTGNLNLESVAGGTDAADRAWLPQGSGLTGRVLETGETVLQMSPGRDARFDPELDTPPDGLPRPFLGLPIAMRGKVIGVVRAFLPEGAGVSCRTGEVAAAALSAAVRSALLYRSLVSSIEEVAEARRAPRA
jgi:FixJ family two-component response regulator/putative methionine-R-sulfoxide reductase with GAF domain